MVDLTVLKEAIYVVIGVMGVVLAFFIFKPLIMGVLFDIPDQNSIDNFDRLVKNIRISFHDYAEWKKSDDINFDFHLNKYSREVLVNINTDLGIKFYNPYTDDRPSKCGVEERPCVCLAYVEDFHEGKKPYKCENFKEGKGFIFDVNYESFDSNAGDLGGLLVGSGIGGYMISFSNHLVMAIAPNLNGVDGYSYSYEEFTSDDSLVDVVDSTFQGEGESIHTRTTDIDTLVLHYSVTYCGTSLYGEGACPISTSEVLRNRGISIHYSVGSVNANGEYVDTVVTQSTPEWAKAFHAGCLPDSEWCENWCTLNGATMEQWLNGKALCNDLSLQKPSFTRDSFKNINDRSIGIEITNMGFSRLNEEECSARGGIYISPSNGLLSYYSGDFLISKPFESVCWWPFSDALIDKLVDLVAGILERNEGIVLDYDHIIGHDAITYSKYDPGALFPWEEFMTRLANKLGREVPTRNLVCPLVDIGCGDKCPNNFVSSSCASTYTLQTPAMEFEAS